MNYCEDKDTATVIYSFNKGEEKRYTAEKENLPLTVTKETVKITSGAKSSSRFDFDGNNPGSYSFTIVAPVEIPQEKGEEDIEIYLESGTWDDYGGIGSYSTEIGIVQTYGGEPLLVGTGRTIDGTVTNLEPVQCYADISLDWRYEEGCKLVISHQGKILYEETGECPLDFNVVCDRDCPPGHLKCNSNKYPGYCCLPCKDTASKIRALGAKL